MMNAHSPVDSLHASYQLLLEGTSSCSPGLAKNPPECGFFLSHNYCLQLFFKRSHFKRCQEREEAPHSALSALSCQTFWIILSLEFHL